MPKRPLPLLLTLSTLLNPATSYLGPTHCRTPGTSATSVLQSNEVGYSTFNHLLFDLTSLNRQFHSGITIPPQHLQLNICPNTIIDLDDTTLPLGFIPITVPRTTLQCGSNGLRSNNCTIHGGGKYSPTNPNWNSASSAHSQQLKEGIAGIVGGESVAQIYVYGKHAYEVTLRGLTLDNSLSGMESEWGVQYVNVFGGEESGGGSLVVEDVEEELLPSNNGGGGSRRRGLLNDESGNDEMYSDRKYDQHRNQKQQQRQRKLQDEQPSITPAYRFAAVAVRGNGYGDDAGSRIITIDDCLFQNHRGYAVLVSPGIQEPTLPVVPTLAILNTFGVNGDNGEMNSNSGGSTLNEIIDGTNYNLMGGEPFTSYETNDNNTRRRKLNQKHPRKLNLLDNGANFITPTNGKVTYYDTTASINYIDSRRVKISRTEFVQNIAAVNNVAGLVTSAYSLTMTDCYFQSNEAKAMVFAYNNDALVRNTVFAENTVEVATVVLASPEGSEPISSTSSSSSATTSTTSHRYHPTHIVEQTCFLRSRVGMSNVLVTDVEATGFGQRDNHATGTEFTWISECEGAAAESKGHECLEGGRCDGTCVRFDTVECLADMSAMQAWSSGGGRLDRGNFGWMLLVSTGLAVFWSGWL